MEFFEFTTPILVILLVGYVAGAGTLSAVLAHDKGRDVVGWFILGAIYGPLALLALVGLSRRGYAAHTPPTSSSASPATPRPRGRIGDPNRPYSREEFDKSPVGQFIKGGKNR